MTKSNLPPLPKPAKNDKWRTSENGKWVSGADKFYTAEQVRAIQIDAWNEALELQKTHAAL